LDFVSQVVPSGHCNDWQVRGLQLQVAHPSGDVSYPLGQKLAHMGSAQTKGLSSGTHSVPSSVHGCPSQLLALHLVPATQSVNSQGSWRQSQTKHPEASVLYPFLQNMAHMTRGQRIRGFSEASVSTSSDEATRDKQALSKIAPRNSNIFINTFSVQFLFFLSQYQRKCSKWLLVCLF
jgi:hypothetical protein